MLGIYDWFKESISGFFEKERQSVQILLNYAKKKNNYLKHQNASFLKKVGCSHENCFKKIYKVKMDYVSIFFNGFDILIQTILDFLIKNILIYISKCTFGLLKLDKFIPPICHKCVNCFYQCENCGKTGNLTFEYSEDKGIEVLYGEYHQKKTRFSGIKVPEKKCKKSFENMEHLVKRLIERDNYTPEFFSIFEKNGNNFAEQFYHEM